MAGNLEDFRREALDERRRMQQKLQDDAEKRAHDLGIGAIASDDPLNWDPGVRKAKADLLRAKSLLGAVPPSMYQDAVEACEERLKEAIANAEKNQQQAGSNS